VSYDGTEYEVGQLLLSPTRTFLPLIKAALEQEQSAIKGIIHNTGGAHTKVTKFCDEPVHIIKDNLLPVPPVFQMIKEESNADDAEMYKVFNMGTRLEIYVDNETSANNLIDICKSFAIDAQIIGRVEAADSTSVTLTTQSNSQISYT
jgi:phosphoribosylformylglycinamidine cyclo-ligase